MSGSFAMPIVEKEIPFSDKVPLAIRQRLTVLQEAAKGYQRVEYCFHEQVEVVLTCEIAIPVESKEPVHVPSHVPCLTC